MAAPLDSSLLCVSCGYDLRGLPAEGACPECATPIARSLLGDRLAGADVRWLTLVHRGQKLAAWGLTILIAGFGAFVALPFWLLLLSIGSGNRLGGKVPWIVGFGLIGSVVLAGMGMMLAGAVLLTRQEPSWSPARSSSPSVVCWQRSPSF